MLNRRARFVAACLAILGTTAPAWCAPAKKHDPKLTPDLFLAVGRRDTAAVKSLLARRADPNARNVLTFTPLMLAAATGNEAAVKSLLAAGAKLEAPAPYGTALTFAAMGGEPKTIRYLISRGASVDAPRADKLTVAMITAEKGDAATLRAVLDRSKKGIDTQNSDGATALIYAARNGKVETTRLLLERGARIDLADSHGRTALMEAAANGHTEAVKLLLEKGADARLKDRRGRTALMLAVRYGDEAAIVKALLARGAGVNERDEQGQIALSVAAARGHAESVAALRDAGAAAAVSQPEAANPRKAVERGLGVLERSTKSFAKAVGCASCHHQGVGLMAAGIARDRGFTVDAALWKEQMDRVQAQYAQFLPFQRKGLNDPEAAKRVPFAEINELSAQDASLLSALAANHRPANETISISALALARRQAADGSWTFLLMREPSQSTPVTTTAMAVWILNTYMPKAKAAEAAKRIARAKAWLQRTPARTNEELTFRLLGLKWAGASAEELRPAVEALRASQRRDGGWAQLPSLRSDAYATGQALFALHQAGGVPAADPAYRRGVDYLLRTQEEDGSWYVKKRAIPANIYIDGGFPHGESQYISYGATAWAAMALSMAAPIDTTASSR